MATESHIFKNFETKTVTMATQIPIHLNGSVAGRFRNPMQTIANFGTTYIYESPYSGFNVSTDECYAIIQLLQQNSCLFYMPSSLSSYTTKWTLLVWADYCHVSVRRRDALEEHFL
jgi:hypothetical protein